MTIEITRPDIEALILQRLQTSGYTDPQDVIFHALRAAETPLRTGADLIAAMQSSPCRDVELEAPREVLPVRDVSF